MLRNEFENANSAYWEHKQNDPINLLLGEDDGLFHHHFGVGNFDLAVLQLDGKAREDAILAEMHRLESAEVDVLLDALGPLDRHARVLDAGSGRGGTAFMLHERFGCEVDGVAYAQYQVDFAQQLAERRQVADRVSFRYGNMVANPCPDAYYHRVVTNETTMYVDLDEAFAEFRRVLMPGGRYVLATWCSNDAVGAAHDEVEEINEHYICRIHPRGRYFRALADHGFVPRQVLDLTQAAIPYFEVRSASRFATGVERPYLSAYRSDRMNYLIIAADRLP
ncbi:SAM-dependent methyltransferase [Streptomyces sp. NPDC056632]|uniref:SAM-dependent methyltransferase n=1 Tax=Streptomyces sp. NPDC056632 TaxID=3345884 RepID=UPI0036C40DA9